MGWKDELHDASFRGVAFECISVQMSQSKSVAIHQAPYSNAATVEDMGNDAQRFSITAMYSGEDYLQWRNALEAALNATGTGEFIHPTRGIQQVQVLDYSVNEDAETVDYCSFNIQFLVTEEQQAELFIPVQVPTQIDTADIIAAPASRFKSYLDKLKNLQPEQYFSVLKTVRTGLQNVRNGLNLVKKTINDLTSPELWVNGLIDDISSLVYFDYSLSAAAKWRDVQTRVERFSRVFDTADAPKELQQLWRATHVAATVAITQKVVDNARQDLIQQQARPTAQLNQSNAVMSMTPLELAKVRANTRAVIQAAIHAEREYGSLDLSAVDNIQNYKQLADQVHLQIQALIEIRPPIITYVIPRDCTFHWLAHHLYGDLNRASEIARLNQDVQNPALLLKGLEVTVYAR